MPTREDLQILQAQDLELKVALTKQRIREWVTAFSSQGVYVSFSDEELDFYYNKLVKGV